MPAIVQAQWTSVPNSGCPGSLAPNHSPTTSIGTQFKMSCNTSGRATAQLLMIGGCIATPIPISAPLACGVYPCGLAINLGAAILINTGFQTQIITIPSNSAFIGTSACFQCLELTSTNCITLSEALNLAITI